MRFLGCMNSPTGRGLPVAVGAATVTGGLVLGGGWWALAVLGLLPLLTGALGICPVTAMAGRRARCDTRN